MVGHVTRYIGICALLWIIKAAVIPSENNAQAVALNHNNLEPNSSFYTRFCHGFVASIYVIIISELGDKTFFIAAILAIDHSRSVVYAGAMFALITMTVLSAFLGFATEILPRIYTYYASGFLFVIFGISMLRDAYRMNSDNTKEEYQEVEQTISENNTKGPTKCVELRSLFKRFLSPIFAEAFIMIFLAEWGDRSQITTVVLASREDIVGVIVGGVVGHGLCTGLAVLAGRLVAQRIPVRWLTFVGGFTFVMFGVATFASHPYAKSF